jgi:hypothetical protein
LGDEIFIAVIMQILIFCLKIFSVRKSRNFPIIFISFPESLGVVEILEIREKSRSLATLSPAALTHSA